MHSTDSPLRHYLSVLRRRFVILAFFTVVVPCIAVAVATSRTAVFEATSSVLINRQSLANQLSGTSDVGLQQQSFQQVLLTQTRLATTPSVIRDALGRAKVAGVSEDEFRKESTAGSSNDILTFSVKNTSPQAAKRLSLAYANAFVAYRLRLDSAALTRALSDLTSAINRASPQAGSGSGDSALRTRLMASRQELETRLALQTANAQVVAGPDTATKVSPRPLLTGVAGLFLGLLVGVCAAAAREFSDTRVRTSSEIEQALDLPVLSRLSKPKIKPGASELVMANDRQSVQAEGFRILRTNLTFGIRSSESRVVMVTSSSQGEGKSTTIANLAIASALSGQSVVVVDLDLRRPRVGSLFGLDPGPGVTGVAIGLSTLAEALAEYELDVDRTASHSGSLQVLQSGAIPPDPAEFVSTEAVTSIVRELRAEFDLVLIDAPPINAVSDASAIAEYVDSVFVCVRLGLVRRPLLRLLNQSLDRIAKPVLGVVVTDASVDSDRSYQASYGYGYGYGGAPRESTGSS